MRPSVTVRACGAMHTHTMYLESELREEETKFPVLLQELLEGGIPKGLIDIQS